MTDQCCAWLVRHAQSAGNAAGLVQGQADGIGLTPLGRLQAARLASRFAPESAPLVISSDLRRAVETARPLALRLGARVRLEPALRERDFGHLQGQVWSERFRAEIGLDDGRVIDADARPTGGESLRELYERVGGFLDRLSSHSRDWPVVLVTHGGPIRVAHAWLDDIGVDGMSWPTVDNASATPIWLRHEASHLAD